MSGIKKDRKRGRRRRQTVGIGLERLSAEGSGGVGGIAGTLADGGIRDGGASGNVDDGADVEGPEVRRLSVVLGEGVIALERVRKGAGAAKE